MMGKCSQSRLLRGTLSANCPTHIGAVYIDN